MRVVDSLEEKKLKRLSPEIALLEMQGQINLSRLLEFTVAVRQRLKVLTTSNLSSKRRSHNSSEVGFW